MNIRKLSSGSWNVREMIDGQRYSFTFKTKPTKREAEDVIMELRIKRAPHIKGTFKSAAEELFKVKDNVISPSTLRGYKSILRNLSDEFKNIKLSDITQLDVQKELNTYAIGRSAHSVRNASGFISSVIYLYRPELKLNTKLPQKEDKTMVIPKDEDVKRVVAAIKGTQFEAVIILAALGLRQSEAFAVTAEDIDENNILTINKAYVRNPENKYVLKTTKTTSSTRSIWIPDYLANLIREKGCAYEGSYYAVLKYLHKVQDQLGIPRFKYHALRHYYVSMAHAQGIPDASIAATVGHKNTNTTRSIYLHAISEEQISNQQAAAKFLDNVT